MPSLARVELMLTAGGGFASLSLDPLPNLLRARGIDKDDEVLEGPLGDLGLNLAPHRVLRYHAVGSGATLKDGEIRLLRHGFEGVFVAVNGQG